MKDIMRDCGGIESTPELLIKAYGDFPTIENQIKVRATFKALRPYIEAHFGKEKTCEFAAKLDIKE